MVKLIVSDIDETLVSSDKTINRRNKLAIKKAQEMGIKVILASGRGPYQLRNILEEIDIEKENRFSILCNGGIIMDNLSKKIVDSSPIGFEKANKIFHYAYKNNLHFEIYTDKSCYTLREDKNIPPEKYDNVVFLTEDSVDFLKDEIIIKSLIKNTDLNFLMSMEEDIARLCEWDCHITYSSDIYMEINAKNVNKAIALKKVCDHYGILLEDTLVIGDNYNDKEMLEAGGISVAVQNSHLLLKEIADYTTIATNNEGAVGEAIEKFVINKKKSNA